MPDGPEGAPDWGILRELQARAETHPLLTRAVLDRSERELVVSIAPARYPGWVEDATLAVTWYLDDSHRFHYRERHDDGTVWQCGWDRHLNPHAAAAHFHPPPDGDAGSVVDDAAAPDAPADALSRVLANVRDRIEDLWGNADTD